MTFNYKNLIKNRDFRLKILNSLSFIPDKWMLSVQYWLKTYRTLNFNNPIRFTEKIQWYKLNYRNSIMNKCVDKYLVREYVEEKGLDYILVKLLGQYDSINKIDFDKLPDKFIVKRTNGGGGNNVIICLEKSKLNFIDLERTLDLKENSNVGREWAYNNLKPRIVIEELLINKDNPNAGINDYKIFCYSGKPKYIVVDVERYINHKRNFYDIYWNKLDITSDCEQTENKIDKPKNLEKMLEIASKLSEDFPFVRVDLYNVDGKIYFGELTFYPWSGYVRFFPDEFDYELGKEFKLNRSI